MHNFFCKWLVIIDQSLKAKKKIKDKMVHKKTLLFPTYSWPIYHCNVKTLKQYSSHAQTVMYSCVHSYCFIQIYWKKFKSFKAHLISANFLFLACFSFSRHVLFVDKWTAMVSKDHLFATFAYSSNLVKSPNSRRKREW